MSNTVSSHTKSWHIGLLVWFACIIATIRSVCIVFLGSAAVAQTQEARPDGKGGQIGSYICPQYQNHRQVGTMRCDFEDLEKNVKGLIYTFSVGFLALVVIPIFFPLGFVFYGYVIAVTTMVYSTRFRNRFPMIVNKPIHIFLFILLVTTALQTTPFLLLQATSLIL